MLLPSLRCYFYSVWNFYVHLRVVCIIIQVKLWGLLSIAFFSLVYKHCKVFLFRLVSNFYYVETFWMPLCMLVAVTTIALLGCLTWTCSTNLWNLSLSLSLIRIRPYTWQTRIWHKGWMECVDSINGFN